MTYSSSQIDQFLSSYWPDLQTTFPDSVMARQGLLAWSRAVTQNGFMGGKQTNNFAGVPELPDWNDPALCDDPAVGQQLKHRCVRLYPSPAEGVAEWRYVTTMSHRPSIADALKSGATVVLSHALWMNGLLGPNNGQYPTKEQVVWLKNLLNAAMPEAAAVTGQTSRWTVEAPIPTNPVKPPISVPEHEPSFDLDTFTKGHGEEVLWFGGGALMSLIFLYVGVYAPRRRAES